ncbi:MAG: polymer-forming cytoskeletal protein [Candidatus Thorarchaeota archaeon]|nr:polymer-forming cytoskeletal protein [Candidatus Thorarchaeota archaeon]
MTERVKFKGQPRLELGAIEGDIEISDCDFVVPREGTQILINGNVRVEGDVIFGGALKAKALHAKAKSIVTVEGDLDIETTAFVDRGDLEVHGSASAKEIGAASALRVEGNLTCSGAKAGGSIKVRRNAKAHRMSAGGSVHIEGDAEADRVSAGGSVAIDGRATVSEVSAGGSVKCNTGRIGKVDVGGSFKALGAVEVDEIDVGGSGVVGPGSTVHSVDIGGSFKSDGNLSFGVIDVGGSVRLGGDSEGSTIDVGGALSVDGSLHIKEDLDVGGKIEIEKDLRCNGTIKIGGTIFVGGRIDTYRLAVGGRAEAKYIRATDGFRIGRRGEVRGFVESRDIVVRERARTEALYGEQIRVEERARVRHLYARDIYLEREVVIEGTVMYTDDLETEDGVRFKEEPRKVDQLPPPEEVAGQSSELRRRSDDGPCTQCS